MIPVHPVKTNDMIRQLLKQREKLVEALQWALNMTREHVTYLEVAYTFTGEALKEQEEDAAKLEEYERLLARIKGESNDQPIR